MKVLLIEPNRVLGKTYHDALRSAGHQVQTCATAQAAVLAADRMMPDIVILELQLVAHSGIEFLYEFRSYADWRAIPVLAHTNVPPTQFGNGTPAARQQFGIAEYFYKPTTSLQTLLAAVQQYAVAPA